MNVQYIIPCWSISALIAEDAGAPELRNPNLTSMRRDKGIQKVLRKLFSRFGA